MSPCIKVQFDTYQKSFRRQPDLLSELPTWVWSCLCAFPHPYPASSNNVTFENRIPFPRLICFSSSVSTIVCHRVLSRNQRETLTLVFSRIPGCTRTAVTKSCGFLCCVPIPSARPLAHPDPPPPPCCCHLLLGPWLSFS